MERRELRASFYALQQLMRHLRGFSSIARVRYSDDNVRVYELTRADETSWIAWYESDALLLPGDSIPTLQVDLPTNYSSVNVESLITQFGQTKPEAKTVRVINGVVKLNLSPTPIFVTGAR